MAELMRCKAELMHCKAALSRAVPGNAQLGRTTSVQHCRAMHSMAQQDRAMHSLYWRPWPKYEQHGRAMHSIIDLGNPCTPSQHDRARHVRRITVLGRYVPHVGQLCVPTARLGSRYYKNITIHINWYFGKNWNIGGYFFDNSFPDQYQEINLSILRSQTSIGKLIFCFFASGPVK